VLARQGGRRAPGHRGELEVALEGSELLLDGRGPLREFRLLCTGLRDLRGELVVLALQVLARSPVGEQLAPAPLQVLAPAALSDQLPLARLRLAEGGGQVLPLCLKGGEPLSEGAVLRGALRQQPLAACLCQGIQVGQEGLALGAERGLLLGQGGVLGRVLGQEALAERLGEGLPADRADGLCCLTRRVCLEELSALGERLALGRDPCQQPVGLLDGRRELVGALARRGVLRQEQAVPIKLFLAEMASRGISLTMAERSPVHEAI